jgi:hypothetical protein
MVHAGGSRLAPTLICDQNRHIVAPRGRISVGAADVEAPATIDRHRAGRGGGGVSPADKSDVVADCTVGIGVGEDGHQAAAGQACDPRGLLIEGRTEHIIWHPKCNCRGDAAI